MLGRNSGHLKQRADVEVPLAADDVTVAQILKQSGYHTGLIGGWDLGGDGTTGAPWNKGFDELPVTSTPPTRKIFMPTMFGVTIQQCIFKARRRYMPMPAVKTANTFPTCLRPCQ